MIRHRYLRTIFLGVLLAIGLESGGAVRAQQATQAFLSVMDALELYELGDPETIKLVATPRQIGSIETELIKSAQGWIRANGPTEAPRRRLVAATFALEAARHGLETTDGFSTLRLIEWASTELRVDRTPHPGERLWRIAVLSLLADWLAHFSVETETKGVTPLTLFEKHLGFAEQRFPGEPRWILSRGFVAELRAIQMFLRSPPLEGAVLIPPDVVRLYESALTAPAVRAEASIRLGYLWLVGGNPDAAIAHTTRAAETGDADTRYLAHLIRGWALTRLGRHDEAISAFRLSHLAKEDGQTAALWLANALVVQGRREEAVAVVDQSLQIATEPDPWRLHYRGPFRLWPSLIQQLREAIR